MTRFPLAGEAKVTFGLRFGGFPNRQSLLKLRLNWDPDTKSGFETTYFNKVSRIRKGKPQGAPHLTKLKNFRGHPNKWFPKREGTVRVKFALEGGRCVAGLEKQELVAVKANDDGGRVCILFHKVVLTVQNLKLSGKVDFDWCKERLAELEAEGQLDEGEPAGK